MTKMGGMKWYRVTGGFACQETSGLLISASMSSASHANVDYDTLDRAKSAFIDAARRTSGFAARFGFIPDGRLGGSANVFSLDLTSFLKARQDRLFVTLVPEGLGTADDAKPDDLSPSEQIGFWHNIGVKIVSALTNDAVSSGMQTVLISLYLPSSTPELVFNPEFMSGFLDGFVASCRKVGCVYFSGETPQLKEKIVDGKIDIAGALFGLMPAGCEPVDGSYLGVGNKIVFVESAGPHENGFTVLRSLAAQLPQGYRTKLPSGMEYWQAINSASHLYTPFIQGVLAAGIRPTGIEMITGHGWQKIMRSSAPLSYVIDNMLPVPEIFQFVQNQSGKSTLEMLQIFNYGVGTVLFAANETDAQKIVAIAQTHDLNATIAGTILESTTREVKVLPLNLTLSDSTFTLSKG